MRIIHEGHIYESVNSISSKLAIKKLNEFFDLDPDAISKLFATRVKCNKELAENADVFVRDEGNGEYSVGILGILNGIFGHDAKGIGHIKAEMEDGEELQGFYS